MDFKETLINFFSILELLRGPFVWPSRARFGRRAANWRPLPYTVYTPTAEGNFFPLGLGQECFWAAALYKFLFILQDWDI